MPSPSFWGPKVLRNVPHRRKPERMAARAALYFTVATLAYGASTKSRVSLIGRFLCVSVAY